MVAKLSVLASMLPLFSALLVKATPIAHGNGGMMKRFDENQALYMLDYGCYKDDINDHVFPARPKTDIPMDKTTVKACYEACLSEDWRLAGLQNGNECWCSNYSVDKEKAADMAECDRPCSGDENTNCGGANRMHVWSFLAKDRIESFAPNGDFTPIYTYSLPERTSGGVYQNTPYESIIPATTIEVVARVTGTGQVEQGATGSLPSSSPWATPTP